MKNNRVCYHINDGLYHSFNCVLMDGVSFEDNSSQYYSRWAVHDKVEQCSQVGGLYDGSMFGMTCDGYDIVAR